MIDVIKETVAGYYGLKPEDLTRKTKERYFSQPRQIAIYLCRDLTGAGWSTLGREFGMNPRSAQGAYEACFAARVAGTPLGFASETLYQSLLREKEAQQKKALGRRP